MNTHRITPLQALAIADTGGREHRDTDRLALLQGLTKNYFNILIGKYFNRKIFLQGHTDRRDTDTGRQARPCWLSLPRSMMMHHKGNERSQGHRNTDRLALHRSYPYRRIPTQENRNTGEYRPTIGDH